MTEPWAARLRGGGWCGYFDQGPVMETLLDALLSSARDHRREGAVVAVG